MEGSFHKFILRESNQITSIGGKENMGKDDGVRVPKVGMIFSSEKEMREYCTEYAESVGFDIAKRSTKCGADGKQRYFSLACSRNGQTISAARTSFNPKCSYKTNCKAKINILVKSDDVYMITRVSINHNHELTPGKARYFRYNKVFKPYAKRKFDLNDVAASMRLKRSDNSTRVEAAQVENFTSPQKEPKKHKAAEDARNPKLDGGDVKALLNTFSHMQAIDPTFFYTMDVDEEGWIRNVFWADQHCRAAYESFPDVVTFDTTSLNRNSDLPLASFVGVNHHGQPILLGCALIFTENTKTFHWVFKSWLTCMRGRFPKTLVSYQDEALQLAIKEVFSHSHHFLCASTIMEKVPVILQGYPKSLEIERALKTAVYDSLTSCDFENCWRRTIAENSLNNNEWLKEIYQVREKWVPVYTKSIFSAGMSTACKMNAFFQDFFHEKTTLMSFLVNYPKAWERSIQEEKNADFSSLMFAIPTMTNHPVEKHIQKVYTNYIFKIFQEEWKGLIFCNASLSRVDRPSLTFEVAESVYNNEGTFVRESTCEVLFKEEESEINCSCCLFERTGILCRHIISVLIKRNACQVPSRYILQRWRKDIKRREHKNHARDASFEGSSNERRCCDELSPLLFGVQQLAMQSQEKCEFLKNVLKQLKAKFSTKDHNRSGQVFWLTNIIFMPMITLLSLMVLLLVKLLFRQSIIFLFQLLLEFTEIKQPIVYIANQRFQGRYCNSIISKIRSNVKVYIKSKVNQIEV